MNNKNGDMLTEIDLEAPDNQVVRVKKLKTTTKYDLDAYHTMGLPHTKPKTGLDADKKKKLRKDFDALL